MRLRYFHIRNYPPLNDLEVVFSAQSPLNTTNAIHFIVGINGSGKTHLLQALTETFLCMESKQSPKYGVTLVYELGNITGKKQTYVFDHNPEQGTHWWQSSEGFVLPPESSAERFTNTLIHLHKSSNSGWSALIVDGTWPGSGSKNGLPKSILTYTTGLTTGWEELFLEPAPTDEPDWESEPEEHPLGWTMAHAIQSNISKTELSGQSPIYQLELKKQKTEVCQFITPFMLKLAVVAVTLNQALDELKQYRTVADRQAFINGIRDKTVTTGLRGLLSQVGWVWPVSLVIECRPHSDVLDLKDENKSATKFWQAYLNAATTILPGFLGVEQKHRVIFDIDNRKKREALEALFDLSKSPFSIFQQMLKMHHEGLLDTISIALRKVDTDDILLFDELSDGEQMYLGRMALFHLLEGQDDALLLLDEPETHFNDRWKRDLVDIIDQVLGKQANHVLISTHSGITLTDVFTDEITVIEKNEAGNPQHKILEGIHTFGATPDHPLRDVFGAPGTVGKRASALLDVLLLCEPNKELIEQLWHPQTDLESQLVLIKEFISSVNSIPEFEDKYSSDRIKTILETLRRVANEQVDTPTVAAVAKYFADIVGPGYYQFDLYQAVYDLTAQGE